MADLNEVSLIGRLTRNPELRTTPSGHSVASFGLATGRKYKGSDGVLKEEVTFVEITCWGRVAESVSKYMSKGSQVYVGGRLKLESWEDKQTGQKRSKLSVVAENIQFLDSRQKATTEPVAQNAFASAPPFSNAEPNWGEPPTSAGGEPPF